MKASTKFTISIIVVFILFPTIGYILIHKSMASANTELTSIATRLSTDTIQVVRVTGEHVTPGVLSISPLLYGKSDFNLNAHPGSIIIKGDTLFLDLDDDSRVYQGYIHLRNIRIAIINSDTIIFYTTKL